MHKKGIIIFITVACIVGIAAFFRLWDITNYPPGLFPDEAANGEDALLILNGDIRPFYERGNGREALFFYLDALSIKLFGIGVWQLHIVPAVVGIATVLAMYFSTKPFFGNLAGILAALFLATNHWHATLSRTGFRAIMIPLFVAAFTAFVGYTVLSVKQVKPHFAKATRGRQVKQARQALWKSYVFAALAGVAFAGGFYTYIAYRVMIGVVLGIFALLLLAAMHHDIGFPHFKRYGYQTLVALVVGLVVFAPLGWYFMQHPDAFFGRAGQVSIFNQDLQREFGGGTLAGMLLFSVRETLFSFFAGGGDSNWRHNVAGFPLLNPLVGILFLLGFAWTIHWAVIIGYKIVRGVEIHMGMIYPYFLLLIVGMLLPVVTTAEGMPHGLRSLGLVVPVFILAGTAGAVGLHWVMQRVTRVWVRASVYGLIGGLMVLGMLYDGALYFLIARNDSRAAYSYRADLKEVASFINRYALDFPGSPRPYLVLDKFSLQTVHFLTSVAAHDYQGHPDEQLHRYEYVEPAKASMTAPEPGRLIIFTQSTIVDADRYYQTQRDHIDLVDSRKNRFNQEIMRVYRGKEIDSATGEKEDTNKL